MTILIIGLLIFLSVHSIRILGESRRDAVIERLGNKGYQIGYRLISLLGLIVIIYGYGQTRLFPVDIWFPPAGLRPIALLLTLIAFILIAASGVPGNRIKAAIGHPMAASVKIWAFAHLLVNGRLGDIVLFGAFLIWAVLSFRAGRTRDRASGAKATAGPGYMPDVKVAIGGVVAWAVFGLFLHAWLIGVNPFG